MFRGFGQSALSLAALAGLLFAQPAAADTFTNINISSLANNNIFTDLNQNFPTTGSGVPGSHTGAANQSFLFSPWSYTPPGGVATSDSHYTVTPSSHIDGPNNGISFQLNSNGSGQDFVQIGTSGATGYTGPNPVTVNIGVNDVTTVYALMASYTGQSFYATFTGHDGSTESFGSAAVPIADPDFFGGAGASGFNNCTSPLSPGAYCSLTAYIVNDMGGGGSGTSASGGVGNYDLTEFEFALNGTLSAEQLASMTITSSGYETLLFGLTTDSVSTTTSVPEPFTLSLFGAGLAGAVVLRRRKKA